MGGTWRAEAAPINLHGFHHLTRQSLLNWWERKLVGTHDEEDQSENEGA